MLCFGLIWGVFYFSCKYLMLCSFPKLDVSKSCSYFHWIPPTPSSLTVHDIELSAYSVFTFLFFSIHYSISCWWWSDIINGQVARTGWVWLWGEMNLMEYFWLYLCSNCLVPKCWPRDCIGVLVFGITLPFEFIKLNDVNKHLSSEVSCQKPISLANNGPLLWFSRPTSDFLSQFTWWMSSSPRFDR